MAACCAALMGDRPGISDAADAPSCVGFMSICSGGLDSCVPDPVAEPELFAPAAPRKATADKGD